MIYKICKKCGEEKIITKFKKCRTAKDGFINICEKCRYIKQKEWVRNNIEKVREKNKKWYKNNLEKAKEYSKKYYKNNIKRLKKNNRKWKKNNIDKIKEYNKKWIKNEIKNNIHFKLKMTISGSIRSRLKRRFSSKNDKSTFSFLPYTVDELKEHLERQFEPWMNWSNWSNKRGCWNIDHIRPDSSFNYKSVEDNEFQECWALKNLRPLEYIENIKKSNKIYV